MSSIAQIGSSLTSQSTSLQSMLAPRGRPPEPTAEMKAQFEAKFESAAEELGIDSASFKELRSKIDEAVRSARSTASEGTDVRSVIDEAVNSVLEENGIDPDEFKAQMGSIFEKMGMPKPGQGGTRPEAKQHQSNSNLSLLSELPIGSFVDTAV